MSLEDLEKEKKVTSKEYEDRQIGMGQMSSIRKAEREEWDRNKCCYAEVFLYCHDTTKALEFSLHLNTDFKYLKINVPGLGFTDSPHTRGVIS